MSQPASRPITSGAEPMVYSRPSVRQTSRPPVAAVGGLGAAPGFAVAATIFATSPALTNWVLPLRRGSCTKSS